MLYLLHILNFFSKIYMSIYCLFLLWSYRKLPNGEPVKKYAELIEYLMSKDKDIKALEMDFEGKNILLYHLGVEPHLRAVHQQEYIIPLRDPSITRDLMCRGPATPEMWWGLSAKIPKHRRCKDCEEEEEEGV
jgi:hypothetical protein